MPPFNVHHQHTTSRTTTKLPRSSAGTTHNCRDVSVESSIASTVASIATTIRLLPPNCPRSHVETHFSLLSSEASPAHVGVRGKAFIRTASDGATLDYVSRSPRIWRPSVQNNCPVGESAVVVDASVAHS